MVPICYAADSNYAMQVAVSMISLLENNRETELVFFVLGDGYGSKILSKFSEIEKKYDTKIITIDIRYKMDCLLETKLADEPGIIKNGNLSYMFARLFIGSVIPSEIKKIIYLDCDTIYVGKIQNLYNININGENIFAAVRDIWPASYNRVIGLTETDLYFISATLLIDLQKWREFECEKKIILAAKNARSYYFMHDQDLLNVCFRGKIQTLSPKYGMIYLLRSYSAEQCIWFSDKSVQNYYSKEEINEAQNDIQMIHYTGDYYGRPWSFPNASADNKEWLKYYKISPWGSLPIGNKHSAAEWGKYFLKKLFAPFVKNLWLTRTKRRFKRINNWMMEQRI